MWGKSRGYIIFRPQVYDVRVISNNFIAPETVGSPNNGIVIENTDKTVLTQSDNSFIGHFDEKLIPGVKNI